MVAIDEKFRFGPSLSGGDRRSVEFVVDSAFALRLGIQGIAAPRLGKHLEAVRGLFSETEENVRLVVGSACRTREKTLSNSIRKLAGFAP